MRPPAPSPNHAAACSSCGCNPSDHRPPLVTPNELAAYTGLTLGHLANLRSAGRGPAFTRLGAAVRYRWSDVAAWIDAGAVCPIPEGRAA